MSPINLPPGTTVVQGEAYAIGLAAHLTLGQVSDLTADCQPAIRQAEQQTPARSKLGTLHDAPTQLHAITITWVSSHLTPDDFKKKHPDLHWWRRDINHLADQLVEKHNAGWYPADQAREIKDLQQCLLSVNKFLGSRVSTVLSWKGAAPPWSEPLQAAKQRASQKAEGLTPAQAYRKGSDGGTNKKDLLRQLVEGQLNAQQGHCWEGHLNKLNATASCRNCGLYLEQTYSVDKFKMLMALPCKHKPAVIPPQLDGVSSTHRWYCLGSELACYDCHCVLKVGKRVPTKIALQVCGGRPTQNSSKRIADQLPKTWPFSQPETSVAGRFPAGSHPTERDPGSGQLSDAGSAGSRPSSGAVPGKVQGPKRQASLLATAGISASQGKKHKGGQAVGGGTTLAQAFRQGVRLPPEVRPAGREEVSSRVNSGQAPTQDSRGTPRQAVIAQWFNHSKPTKDSAVAGTEVGTSVNAEASRTNQGDASDASSGRAGQKRAGEPNGPKLSKPAVRTTAQQKLKLFATRSLDQATEDQ